MHIAYECHDIGLGIGRPIRIERRGIDSTGARIIDMHIAYECHDIGLGIGRPICIERRRIDIGWICIVNMHIAFDRNGIGSGNIGTVHVEGSAALDRIESIDLNIARPKIAGCNIDNCIGVVIFP